MSSTTPNSIGTPDGPDEAAPFVPLDGTLRVPEFALHLTEPVPLGVKLELPFRITRENMCVSHQKVEHTSRINYSDSVRFLLINIARQFTQKSLNAFLSPLQAAMVNIRVISFNENQKGICSLPIQQVLQVDSVAVVTSTKPLSSLSSLIAYGQRSGFLPLTGDIAESFVLYREVYEFIQHRFWVPASSSHTYESKFGGGLSRRVAAPSVKLPRFVIRVLTCELANVDDLGATVVDTSNSGSITNFRFSKMETRDALLDGFIVHLEFCDFTTNKERGIAHMNNCVVLIENSEVLLDLSPIEFAKPFSFNPLPSPPPR